MAGIPPGYPVYPSLRLAKADLTRGRSAGPFADVITAMFITWAETGTTNPFGKIKVVIPNGFVFHRPLPSSASAGQAGTGSPERKAQARRTA